MVPLVAAAGEPSGQSVRLIVVLLLGVAVSLFGLTIWYWRYTDPRRRATSSPSAPHMVDVSSAAGAVVDVSSAAGVGAAVTGQVPISVTSPWAKTAPLDLGSTPQRAEAPQSDVSVVGAVDDCDVIEIPAPDDASAVVRLDEAEPVAVQAPRPIDVSESAVIPDDLGLSVLAEVDEAQDLQLSDDQWEHLAAAVLDAVGWADEAESNNGLESDHSVGALD